MEKVIEYLHEYIDDGAIYVNYNQKARKILSIQLAGSFDFYKTELLGVTVLFLKPTGRYALEKMKKWMSAIEDKTDIPVVVILEDMTPYMTKKMLMEHIAFVVPGKQMNLPFLAMTIKSIKKQAEREIRKFVPATQLIYLYILYEEKCDFEINEISEKLQISSMTAARGMNDLASLGLMTYKLEGKTGRKKIFQRISRKEYYSFGKKYIDNPVRSIVYVSKIPDGVPIIKSDLTALSEQTMLGEPPQMRYALDSKKKSLIEVYIISKEQAESEQYPMVQLLKYDAKMIARDGYIDPVSMIAGLADKDERIEMSIEELMEGKDWYEE